MISIIRLSDVEMKTCPTCNKQSRDKYNLHCHMMMKHGYKEPEEDTVSEEEEETSDEELNPNEETDSGDDSESDGSTSEPEADYEPFDRILKAARNQLNREINEGTFTETDEDKVNRRFQKIFRNMYKIHILWIKRLRRNHIHQRVMDTARRLRDDIHEDYDYPESIDASISKRKHLLNRIVPNFDEDSDNE